MSMNTLIQGYKRNIIGILSVVRNILLLSENLDFGETLFDCKGT